MFKNLILILSIASIALPAMSQDLTQTVRGTVIDSDSNIPLTGVQIIVVDSDPLKGTVTNIDGEFRLTNVPIGRVSLKLSYIGYETIILPDLIVNSGKEVYLDLSMRESVVRMDEIVVKPEIEKGVAMNDMALISSRSISPEETTRYPGGFDDPARILSNFAGVTNSQIGIADIIVRGNSPKYLQWRLEGVPITNPNHFADQTGSGILTALNNNLLATSDFYTAAFSPEYGNALSSVYDLNFRKGNNERLESTFGFGLLGTELTLEGPFRQGYDGSYLINYRYSTITLVDNLGMVPDMGGIPKFQDASFHISLPTKKAGNFSLFGLSGLSSFLFEDVTPDFMQTPGERVMNPNITEDYDKETYLLNAGLKHSYPVNDRSFIQTTLAYSGEGIGDKIYEVTAANTENSPVNRKLNFGSDITKSAIRANITYHNKINARNNIQIGSKYVLFNYDFEQSRLQASTGSRTKLTDFDESAGVNRNFISWKHRLNENITLVSGFQNVNVLLNNKTSIEPRLAVNWKISPKSSFHAGYGKHSTMESIHHYFVQIEQPDGSFTEPNRDLDLLKAHHYVIGYETRLLPNLRTKIELYYQDLYNLPVENSTESSFSTINEGNDFKYVDLVNEGTGKNYGMELTIERFFEDGYYYLLNASLYSSKYTAMDGVERNSKYNGEYLANILVGKEFANLGRKNNQTLSLNAKVFFGGGSKIIPLLRDANGQLAVDTENNRYYDYEKAYETSLDNIHTVTLSASYKWNKPRATHEIFLNIDNATNSKSRISEFYDESAPNSIGYVTQSFFYPNLMYKVYF